jgi:ATP-dependent protease ClpP protease subunit
MTLVPSVTELILAELLYLQYEDTSKPIYLYINSTGTSKVRSHGAIAFYRYCVAAVVVASHAHSPVFILSSSSKRLN